MSSINMPDKLEFLFKPSRYKIAYGGRGSGKSWGFARALLAIGANEPKRILCTREVQKSIRDSVHRLLRDQIAALSMGSIYKTYSNEIRGSNGTEFIFSGLSDQTSDSIKSMEGVDIVWIEEGQSISARSLDILLPTIRKSGSEIWVSMNPELDTDEIYRRFVLHKPDDCVAVEMNYDDNPWFAETALPREMDVARKSLPEDEFLHIWHGKTRKALTGAIYAREVEDAFRSGRVRNVPYDPALVVHTVWDLGWNDATSIIFVQKAGSELRIIDYMEDSFRSLEWYVKEIEKRDWRWGTDYLPHDAAQQTLSNGGRTTEMIVSEMGRKVFVQKVSGVNEGIRSARMVFPRVFFDSKNASGLLRSLQRYRRSTNKHGAAGSPVHDEHSHGADAFRGMAIAAHRMESGVVGDESWRASARRRFLKSNRSAMSA